MAATINDRDVLIAAGTRTQAVTLPSDITVSGDVTGTLNGVPVQDVIDAATAPGSGDVTKDILENSGTTILMSSSNLFKTTTGSGGVFIGGGGLFGKEAGGNTTFAIDGSTGAATFKGTVQAGSIIAVDATIDGVNAVDVKNNASSGLDAYNDTIDFRVPGAPTNSPVIGAITTSSSAVGTVDIKLTWTYTQGAIKADHFILYFLEGTTNPTTSSPILGAVTGDSRDLTISGVPMDKSYKVGIVAARNSAFGVQKTAIVNAWTRTGSTANITANIDGTAPSGVKNSGITLSSSGALLGAGGGSITALPYANVTGGPPANATANFFTQSSSDPSGGADGAAHWNLSTSVMWFKISGTWQKGGTINASQITTGTLAAARIAAGSITSDKISVSTLSAVAANLGTITAGSITGSSDITTSGDIKGDGLTPAAGTFPFGGSLYSIDYSIHGRASSSTTSGRVRCGVVGEASANTALYNVGVYGRATSGANGYGVVGNGIQAGVYGKSNSVGNPGVLAQGQSGGPGLSVDGTMTISSTSLVTNLNADMVDGYHSTSLCRTVGSHSGIATISSSQFEIFSTVSGVSTAGASNDITIYSVSDRRLKQDIHPEKLGLDFIRKLKPVTYRLKDNPEIKHHGFISQDVGKFIDESENDCFFYKNPNGYYGTDYSAMTAPIVKAIQEIDRRLKILEGGK
jgi:hypothetical protein